MNNNWLRDFLYEDPPPNLWLLSFKNILDNCMQQGLAKIYYDCPGITVSPSLYKRLEEIQEEAGESFVPLADNQFNGIIGEA